MLAYRGTVAFLAPDLLSAVLTNATTTTFLAYILFSSMGTFFPLLWLAFGSSLQHVLFSKKSRWVEIGVTSKMKNTLLFLMQSGRGIKIPSNSIEFMGDHLVSVLPQNSFSHNPKIVRPLPPQHGATVLGEVGVLVDRRAVAQLVLHAIDEEENRHQTFESSLHRAAAGEESDVEAKAMGQEGLMMFVNE